MFFAELGNLNDFITHSEQLLVYSGYFITENKAAIIVLWRSKCGEGFACIGLFNGNQFIIVAFQNLRHLFKLIPMLPGYELLGPECGFLIFQAWGVPVYSPSG